MSIKNITQGIHLSQLWEWQVEKTPRAIALVFDNRQLTYKDLNEQANQLAHYLQKQGVVADQLVGLCVEHSLEMVVGMLAILKASGAYLPLDPSYPRSRLAQILADIQLPLILATSHLQSRLPDYQGEIVYLDRWENIAGERKENPVNEVEPDHLAYAIYTSGSTGKPKGVAMSHRSICATFQWMQATYHLTGSDRVLQKTPYSFDISTWEIFWPLITGATVILAKPEGQKDIGYLCELIEREGVSVANFVPSFLATFLEAPQLPTSLRYIFAAGEPLSHALKEMCWRKLPNCQLHNIYGSTENPVATYWHCQPGEAVTKFSLGCPIPGLSIYILDEKMAPVPRGEVGELYVGGEILARGYLNQPELTAARFLANPFLNSHSRIYKTRDFARELPDGNLELLGRSDRLIKIRGMRVELDEIEAQLNQHLGLKQGVVIATEEKTGDKRLIAYATLKEPREKIIQELQEFLKDRLPEYMIPKDYVILAEFPLNNNGKVDRSHLPIPSRKRNLPQEFIPPSTQVEKELADLWTQLLEVEPIGREDNFFNLGGDSLLAIRLLNHVHQKFALHLPLQNLLAGPTIAQMASDLKKIHHININISTLEGRAVEELLAEAQLDPTIYPKVSGQGSVENPTAILLTGGTGFLGGSIFADLLRETQAKIYCLVRSKNEVEIQERIAANLRHYPGINWEDYRDQIVPLNGNLSQPLLGLTEPEFTGLAEEIDTIYHLGASVNFAYPYTALKSANVLGTQEIIRLASQRKLKSIHFTSTTGVFEAAGYINKSVIREDECLEEGKIVYGGYAQSKWVAEKLLAEANKRGIPITVYRPGQISGHSQTGVSNIKDIFCCLLSGFVQLQAAPDTGMILDICPVDYVSQAIIHLSRQSESIGKTYHLVNPQPLPLAQVVQLIQKLGYPIELLPSDLWVARANTFLSTSMTDTPLGDVWPILNAKLPETDLTYLQIFSTFNIDCINTQQKLVHSRISCPSLDINLLKIYFSYFELINFLPALVVT